MYSLTLFTLRLDIEVNEEIISYLKDDSQVSKLLFKKSEFHPKQSQLAEQVLCVADMSAIVERTFLKAGF
jgi:hypothetical protein